MHYKHCYDVKNIIFLYTCYLNNFEQFRTIYRYDFCTKDLNLKEICSNRSLLDEKVLPKLILRIINYHVIYIVNSVLYIYHNECRTNLTTSLITNLITNIIRISFEYHTNLTTSLITIIITNIITNY